MTFTIDHTKRITLTDLKNFLNDKEAKVVLSDATKKSISDCRNYLDEKIKKKPAAHLWHQYWLWLFVQHYHSG